MTRRTVRLTLTLVLALLSISGSVQAAICSVSATSVSFGTYNPLSPLPDDADGSVSYTCQTTLPTTIWIYLSPGDSGSFLTRKMAGSGDHLFYNLYLDATRAVIWGDGGGGSQAYTDLLGIGTVSQTIPLYGRALPLQDVGVGGYSDAVAVTILF